VEDELEYAAVQVKVSQKDGVKEVALLANPEDPASFWREINSDTENRLEHNKKMISEFRALSEYLKDLEYKGKISIVLSVEDLEAGVMREFEELYKKDPSILKNLSIDFEDNYDASQSEYNSKINFAKAINKFDEYGVSINLSKPKYLSEMKQHAKLNAVKSVKLDVYKILKDLEDGTIRDEQVRERISPAIEHILDGGHIDTITYVGVENKSQEDRLRKILSTYAEPHNIQIQGNVDMEKTNDLNDLREVINERDQGPGRANIKWRTHSR